jgi:hypothetical protein
MTNKDPLQDQPFEKARRERSPDEAVEETEKVLENEQKEGDDMPPVKEDYGGPEGKVPKRD